jgi:hypothetical protein
MIAGGSSGSVVVPGVLRFLPEELRLEREDVIEHAVDAPSLEPVVRDDPRVLELEPQRRPELTVDADLAPHLGLLQDLEAPV